MRNAETENWLIGFNVKQRVYHYSEDFMQANFRVIVPRLYKLGKVSPGGWAGEPLRKCQMEFLSTFLCRRFDSHLYESNYLLEIKSLLPSFPCLHRREKRVRLVGESFANWRGFMIIPLEIEIDMASYISVSRPQRLMAKRKDVFIQSATAWCIKIQSPPNISLHL